MFFNGIIRSTWQRLLTRNTAFSGRYKKLRLLYSMPDPWNMKSRKEQERFKKTNIHLSALSPRYKAILEIGCGEGHQTEHLLDLADTVCGIDLSTLAIQRAKSRCPTGNFYLADISDVASLLPDVKFDLVTACEVLYYSDDIESILEECKKLAPVVYVSNYKQRSIEMRGHFSGEGWNRLEDIHHDGTTWECFLWRRPVG